MTTGRPASVPSSSRPTWPGAVAAGQPGSSANGIETGVLDVVGEPAEAGAEDDPELRDEVGAGADGGHERVEPGGLVGRGDRAGGVDRGGCRRVGHERAGLKERVQGEDGRGPRLRSPDGRTDTGMPVAIRRAIAHGSDKPSVAGNKAPEATGRSRRPLM